MKVNNIYSKKSTLKEVSKDSKNKEYMTESDLEIIDFDREKEDYVTKMKIPISPKSCDALYRDKNKNYFIEFKNGKVETYKVRKKVYDSILIHCDITGEKISNTRENSTFILVYDYEKNKKNKEYGNFATYIESSNSYDKFIKGVSSLAKEEIIKFRLNDFKGYLVKEVHTYTVKEFEEFLKNILKN